MDGIWVSGAFDTHIARAYCGSARALPDNYVFLRGFSPGFSVESNPFWVLGVGCWVSTL
jgi:hypothetical protein